MLVTYFNFIGEQISPVHRGHCSHRCPYTWFPSASSLTLYRKHCPVVFNDYRASGHEGHMTACAWPSEDSGENYQQVRQTLNFLRMKINVFISSATILSRHCRKSYKNINIRESTITWEKMSLKNHQCSIINKLFFQNYMEHRDIESNQTCLNKCQ